MARTYAMLAKTEIKYVFDIEQPVGPNCPNNRFDVLLAQYMLGIWLSRMPYDQKIDGFLKGKLPVRPDGVFGNKTRAYIEALEMWCNGPGNYRVVADSRLDPMSGGMGTESGASKKMWRLNNELFFAKGLDGGTLNSPIAFPPELRPLLFR